MSSVSTASVPRLDGGGQMSSDYSLGTTGIIQLHITVKDINSVLGGINPNHCKGSDGILKTIMLSVTICSLSQAPTIWAGLPSDWKIAVVLASHKGGPRTHLRLLILMHILCKCLERLVRGRLSKCLTKYLQPRKAQHGFAKWGSCFSNLLRSLDGGYGKT